MNDIKKKIQEHLQLMDGFLNFEVFTGKNLVEWIEPLIKSLTDDGAISYLMESKNKERYRVILSILVDTFFTRISMPKQQHP